MISSSSDRVDDTSNGKQQERRIQKVHTVDGSSPPEHDQKDGGVCAGEGKKKTKDD
jgi:hypothetical protein